MADEITTDSEDTGLHDNNFANEDSLYGFPGSSSIFMSDIRLPLGMATGISLAVYIW